MRQPGPRDCSDGKKARTVQISALLPPCPSLNLPDTSTVAFLEPGTGAVQHPGGLLDQRPRVSDPPAIPGVDFGVGGDAVSEPSFTPASLATKACRRPRPMRLPRHRVDVVMVAVHGRQQQALLRVQLEAEEAEALAAHGGIVRSSSGSYTASS